MFGLDKVIRARLVSSGYVCSRLGDVWGGAVCFRDLGRAFGLDKVFSDEVRFSRLGRV